MGIAFFLLANTNSSLLASFQKLFPCLWRLKWMTIYPWTSTHRIQVWLCRLHLYTIFYAPYMYITFICYYPLPLCLASILSKLLIRRRTLCERRALYFCIFSPLVFYGNVPVCERRRHNIQSTVERRSCRSAPCRIFANRACTTALCTEELFILQFSIYSVAQWHG